MKTLRANALTKSVTQRANPSSGFEPGHQRHTTRAVRRHALPQRRRPILRWTNVLELKAAKLSAAVAILALAACSPPPPIVSADTSCERFAHISATDAQIRVYQDNWAVMESYADQVVSHNIEYDKSCLGPVKP